VFATRANAPARCAYRVRFLWSLTLDFSGTRIKLQVLRFAQNDNNFEDQGSEWLLPQSG
jgi:hypothetical protein